MLREAHPEPGIQHRQSRNISPRYAVQSDKGPGKFSDFRIISISILPVYREETLSVDREIRSTVRIQETSLGKDRSNGRRPFTQSHLGWGRFRMHIRRGSAPLKHLTKQWSKLRPMCLLAHGVNVSKDIWYSVYTGMLGIHSGCARP